MSGTLHSEETEDETQQVQQRNAARGRRDAELEVLGGLDHARPICEEQRAERPEREEHRLADDPGVPGLEHHGDPAERDTFQGGVDGGRVRGPRLLENRDQGDDEPGHDGHHDPCPQARIGRSAVPDVAGSHQQDAEGKGGLVDCSPERHLLGAGNGRYFANVSAVSAGLPDRMVVAPAIG